MSRENERRAAFKKTVDDSDGRRRREETTKQIRKSKKEDQLRKRRMGMSQAEERMGMDQSEGAMTTTADGSHIAPNNPGKRVTVDDIPQFKSVLDSNTATMEDVVEATRGIRRILSVERDPPVDTVLQAGVLPHLVRNLVANPQAATLIFESAWALTNVASTTKTHVVVEAGAIEPLIQLMRHENPDVREQAAWCLGNIAGDKQEFRDLLLFNGIVEPLLLNMKQPASISLLNNVTWTLSNLCRGKPAPDMLYLAPAINPLVDLLHNTDVTVEVKVDTVWALSYLSDGPNDRIEQVMQTGVTSKLVEYLSDMKSPLLTPTIRCLGNFVTGSDFQTQAVVDAGIVKHLGALLDHPKRNIRKETCWLASNIAAGTHQQITSLMRDSGLMIKLVDTAMNSTFETKKEALWTLSNICTTGHDEHVKCLVQGQGMEPLADVLSLKNVDAPILNAALDAIERILDVGERHNEDYAKMFDECNGIDHLEGLQEHPSNSVYEKTVKIIETYFGGEEHEDENLAPVTSAAGTFEFGISSPKQLFPTQGPMAVTPTTYQFGIANRAI